MKALLLILGLVLALGGGYVLVQGMSVTTNESSMKVGPLEASVSEKRTIPPWLGGVAAAVGVAFIIAGAMKKNA